MDQLSSFLPAVFEAFGSQSADVRKVKELKKKT
jgi:CLIP-associating protein 1/2